MNRDFTVALVGIGGYGKNYVSLLLETAARPNVRLIAAADPNPLACPYYDRLVSLGVPIYASIEALYAHHRPDLVVITTPIQYHANHSVLALNAGSHVLCEKPVCATIAQLEAMISARNQAAREVAIGYQWSFSETYQSLKRDIAAGDLGRPIRLSTICCWPRGHEYYARNRWAGRKYDDDGNPVFDSPVNNACAHSLHNMFYLLGDSFDRSAMPAEVTADLYRAAPIENYDTAAMRCVTISGVEVLFYVSHATKSDFGPVCRYEFEDAVVTFDSSDNAGVVAYLSNGSIRRYGAASHGVDKLWDTIDAIQSGQPVCCGIEAAAAQTHAMITAQENEIVDFPASLVRERICDTGIAYTVDGLEEYLMRCFNESKLPSELTPSWAGALPV